MKKDMIRKCMAAYLLTAAVLTGVSSFTVFAEEELIMPEETELSAGETEILETEQESPEADTEETALGEFVTDIETMDEGFELPCSGIESVNEDAEVKITDLEFLDAPSQIPLTNANDILQHLRILVTYSTGETETVESWYGTQKDGGIVILANKTQYGFTLYQAIYRDDREVDTFEMYHETAILFGDYTLAVYVSEDPAVKIDTLITIETPANIKDIAVGTSQSFDLAENEVIWYRFNVTSSGIYSFPLSLTAGNVRGVIYQYVEEPSGASPLGWFDVSAGTSKYLISGQTYLLSILSSSTENAKGEFSFSEKKTATGFEFEQESIVVPVDKLRDAFLARNFSAIVSYEDISYQIEKWNSSTSLSDGLEMLCYSTQEGDLVLLYLLDPTGVKINMPTFANPYLEPGEYTLRGYVPGNTFDEELFSDEIKLVVTGSENGTISFPGDSLTYCATAIIDELFVNIDYQYSKPVTIGDWGISNYRSGGVWFDCLRGQSQGEDVIVTLWKDGQIVGLETLFDGDDLNAKEILIGGGYTLRAESAKDPTRFATASVILKAPEASMVDASGADFSLASGESRWYQFTPKEEGIYTISAKDCKNDRNIDADVYILSESGMQIIFSNNEYQMEKDTTYLIHVYDFDDNEVDDGLLTIGAQSIGEHTTHDWKLTDTHEANCTANGENIYTCTVCGDTKKDAVPALGHDWVAGQITVAATATTAAQRQYECSRCHAKETRTEGNPLPVSEMPQTPQDTAPQTTIPQTETEAPILKVPETNVKMKKGQATTAFSVTMAEGDSIVSVVSSNKKLLKVSNINKAKGTFKLKANKKGGKVKLTIKLASGLEKTVTVNVQAKKVTTTKISDVPKKLSMKAKQSVTLEPTLKPITTQDKLTYTSSDKSVATVSGKGVIKAKKAGTTTITVKSGKKSVKCVVTVK